jgi:hypothetical protein
MATTNELGFGSLASVAWTDMNGTGLTSTQLDEVNADISAASTIASALIDVIKGAVKAGWTRFNLSDLSAGYFQLTNLRTDTSSATDDRASDWADFISMVTGEAISATRDLSLNEWRRVAAELQDHASQQASRRSPEGDGGGIKTVNGHWYVNGQQLSLLDAYMAIRVNQVANFDDSLNIYIAELNENNRLVQGANDWLSTLRSEKPTTTNAATLSSSFRTSFSSVWGFDPVLAYHPTDTSGTTISNMSAPSGYKSFDTWIDNVKGYVDAKDTSNQTVQHKLEQMTNRRSEVLDGLTSFAKAQTQTGSSFARNLG